MSENNSQSAPSPSTPQASSPSSAPEAKKSFRGGMGSGGMRPEDFMSTVEEVEIDEEEEQENGEPENSEEAEEEGETEESEEDSEESDEDSSEDSSEDEAEDDGAEEVSKKASAVKGFKAKGADGKEMVIPEDVVILKKVDGEVREIKLKDHLDLVAGELTVNQRMSKIASFKVELDKKMESLKEREAYEQNVLKLAQEGKADRAIMLMAERNKISPVQMYRAFLNNMAKAAKSFEDKTPAEIENHFLTMESQWYKEQQEKAQKEQAEKHQEEQFVTQVEKEIIHQGLTIKDFEVAANQLKSQNKLEGLSREAAADKVIDHALEIKHSALIGQALDKVNPELKKNRKLVALLLEKTNPHDYSVADLVEILKDVLDEERTRIASKLSKKSTAKVASSQKKSEAKQETKKLKTLAEFAKAFGM